MPVATTPAAPRDDDELEERLSRPTPEVVDALRRAPGDVIVLGAGGKMGPSLTTMVKRALDDVRDVREVIAVSRFSSPDAASRLEHGLARERPPHADRRVRQLVRRP